MIQHYVIKFVSDLRQVGGFHRILDIYPVSSTNKTDRNDITEIMLKVARCVATRTQKRSCVHIENFDKNENMVNLEHKVE